MIDRISPIFMTIAFSVMSFWGINSVQAKTSAQDLVAPLQAYVDSLQTFSADFVQTQPDETTYSLNESKGHVDLKRPGRLRWHYETPEPQTIVIDGVNVWVYDEDLDQVTVRNLEEIKGDIPLGWLLFNEPIAKKFDIIRSKEENGVTWYNLTPKEATYFQSIDVGMKEGHMIEVVMYQSSDNVTHVTFHHVVENAPITDSYFEFTVPPGVDLIGTPSVH